MTLAVVFVAMASTISDHTNRRSRTEVGDVNIWFKSNHNRLCLWFGLSPMECHVFSHCLSFAVYISPNNLIGPVLIMMRYNQIWERMRREPKCVLDKSE